VCHEVIALSALAADKGNRNVLSDAGVAAVAADAGLRSAALNVFTNARLIKDTGFVEEKLAEVNQLLAHATKTTQAIYQKLMTSSAGQISARG
jgi:methenyltetrahydrofolate cyclohydrolase